MYPTLVYILYWHSIIIELIEALAIFKVDSHQYYDERYCNSKFFFDNTIEMAKGHGGICIGQMSIMDNPHYPLLFTGVKMYIETIHIVLEML